MKKLILVWIMLTLLISCAKQVTYQGYIEGEYTNLASNVGSKLTRLLVKRGDYVKTGQLLYTLASQPEKSQLIHAKAQLASAQAILKNLQAGQRETIIAGIEAERKQASASLKLAEINLKRTRKLYQEHAIDKASVDQADTSYQRALQYVNQINANLKEAKLGARSELIRAQIATINAAKAAIQQMEWQLAQKSMYAPVSALVFDTYYRVGEFVAAQHPVLSLLALKNIKLVFYVPEAVRGQLKLGQEVIFNCDNCQKNYHAKITFISPQAEYSPPVIFSQESRKKLVYRIEASLSAEEAKQLNVGQPVDVSLIRSNNSSYKYE